MYILCHLEKLVKLQVDHVWHAVVSTYISLRGGAQQRNAQSYRVLYTTQFRATVIVKEKGKANRKGKLFSPPLLDCSAHLDYSARLAQLASSPPSQQSTMSSMLGNRQQNRFTQFCLLAAELPYTESVGAVLHYSALPSNRPDRETNPHFAIDVCIPLCTIKKWNVNVFFSFRDSIFNYTVELCLRKI